MGLGFGLVSFVSRDRHLDEHESPRYDENERHHKKQKYPEIGIRSC